MKNKITLLFVLLNIGNIVSYGQKNNVLSKTKSQIKLTEAKQFFFQGNIKTALLSFKEIIALNPLNSKAQFGAASCYYKLKDYKNAQYHAEISLENDPKADDELHYLLAEIYFREAQYEKAINHYERYQGIGTKLKLKENQIELKLKQINYSKNATKDENSPISITNMGRKLNSKGPEYAPS